MYIRYWDKYVEGRYSISVDMHQGLSIGLYPSECQWIVPGTIDPNND